MGLGTEPQLSTAGKRRMRLLRGMKLLSLAVIAMLLMGMLLACGDEDEDPTGTSGTGNGGNTPTTGTGNGGSTPTTGNGGTPTADNGGGTPTDEGIAHPTGADEPILVITNEGGFVMPTFLLTRLPLFVLLGDGTIVTEGPQIEIYPQPALPNLQATQISEEGIQKILEAAKAAGLLDGDADYPVASIADASTTVFTINADGKTIRVSAYALSQDEFSSPDLTPEQVAARKKLADFLAEITDMSTFLPADMIVEAEHPYDITRLQTVFVPSDSSLAPQIEDGIEQQELEWPSTTPIADLEPFFMEEEGLVCGVVEGTDLMNVLELLKQANQLTLWSDPVMGDAATPGADDAEPMQYNLFLRPLFPGEEGCNVDEIR